MPDPGVGAFGGALALVIIVIAVPVIIFAMVRDSRLKRSAPPPKATPTAAFPAPRAAATTATDASSAARPPSGPDPVVPDGSAVDYGERALAGLAALESGVIDVAVQAGRALAYSATLEHREAGMQILRGVAATGDRVAIEALRSACEPEPDWIWEDPDWHLGESPRGVDGGEREPAPDEVEYDLLVVSLMERHDSGDVDATFELGCLDVWMNDGENEPFDFFGSASAKGHAGAQVCVAAAQLASTSASDVAAAVEHLRSIMASGAAHPGLRAAAALRLMDHFALDFFPLPSRSDDYLATRQRAIDLAQTRAMLSYAEALSYTEALDGDDPSWRQLRRAYLEKAATAGDCDAMLSLSAFFVEDEEGADSEAALRWGREGRRRRGF